MRGSRPPILASIASLAACIALLLTGCAPAGTGDDATAASEQANEAIVLSMIEAINSRDLDALDTLVAADVVRHSQATPGLVITDLAGFRAFIEADLAVVPDSRQEVLHLVAEGDMVAVWATYSGTQQGQMGPFPPTGNPVSADFAGFLRIENGRIAEMWVIWDNLTILTQLGHFPPPGAGPSVE